MPQIFGLLPLCNARRLFADKPRTVTMDAEIILGVTDNGNLEILPAILFHFVPFHAKTDVDPGMYFVQGRVCNMDTSIPVGPNKDSNDYQLAIDAETMHAVTAVEGKLKIAPLQPFLTICSVSGPQKSEREFQVDVNQWFMGSTHTAGFLCNFSATSRRFRQKPPTPRQGATISVTGSISAPCISTQGDQSIRRIVLDVRDIGFPASDSVTLPTSPAKGKGTQSTFAWSMESSSSAIVSTTKEGHENGDDDQNSAHVSSDTKQKRAREESVESASSTIASKDAAEDAGGERNLPPVMLRIKKQRTKEET